MLVGSTGDEEYDTWWVLDARTGERRRAFTRPQKHTLGFEPLVVAGRLVSTAPDLDERATLVAIDPADGTVAWQRALGGAWPTAAPVLAGGHIVVATSGGLVGFDPSTGEERWRLPAEPGPASACRRRSPRATTCS